MLYHINDARTGEIIRAVEGTFIEARCAFDDVLMEAGLRFELDRSFELYCATTDHVVREAAVCLEEIDKNFLEGQISSAIFFIGLSRAGDRELPGKVEDLAKMLSVLKRIENMEADLRGPVSGPTEVEIPF